MKRVTLFLFVLLLTTTAFAAETRRYLVATQRPFAAGGFKALQDSVDSSVELRGVQGFSSFRGFAVELTEDEVETLRASREVRWIEPVVERHALDVRNLRGQTTPYGIDALSARQAGAGLRKALVNVVVIDTGVDYNHPELKAIYAGGYNVFTKTNDPFDDHGHGTHVSGTIAAADNDIGVLGVAPNVRLWAVKMLNSGGSGESEGMLAALDWVVKKKQELGGRWVVNMSLGSDQQSEAEREVFAGVVEEDIIVVAAAGNASAAGKPAPVLFPAAYPGVIAIGAVDSQRKLAYFSCQGPEVAFAAPGVDILSTVPVATNTLSYIIRDDKPILEVSALSGSKRGTLTADYVYCGTGKPEDFPAGGMTGKIALMKRGDLTFADKTRNAKAAGATAVVIFNNDGSTNPWTLYSDAASNQEVWPIVLRLPLAIGEALAAKGSASVTLSHEYDDYGQNSGTSMAAPHVAGAVALLWSFAPDASPNDLYSAMSRTAIDLGAPGRDVEYGAGTINVYAAGMLLSPTAFPGGATTGRGMGRRGRR
jgi:serine protease